MADLPRGPTAPRRRRPSPAVAARRRLVVLLGLALLTSVLVIAFASGGGTSPHLASKPTAQRHRDHDRTRPSGLAGMPPVLDGKNIYSADGPTDLSRVVRDDVPMIYVPNSLSNTVTEIDPMTYRVVRTFPVGAEPQHVVPSWDLKTLWVTSDLGNSLTPINPENGLPRPSIPVRDPYNMYFTPNGRYALVVAERYQRLDFRNPHTMALRHSLRLPCPGVDHMDFSADGTYLIASCEFGAKLVKVDLVNRSYVGSIALAKPSMPQDVKLSPNGRIFYVADMMRNGVWEVDGRSMRVLGFIHTGLGAHGLYVSRNDRDLYVTNRGEGSVSVIAFSSRRVVAKWVIPGGGSPDMGNVSANGKVLWVSGRYNSVVYAIDTTTGRLLARIPVGNGPHGLCVWPQPGRYSLGHTGIMR